MTDQCADVKHREVDRQLNDLYRRSMSLMPGSVDEKRLLSAQRAWLKFVQEDRLYDVGSDEQTTAEQTKRQQVCLTGHLSRRIERLKRYLHCQSENCDSESDLAPMPTDLKTLVIRRSTLIHLGGGTFRKRKSGSLVPFVDGETVRPGDLRLFRDGGTFVVNGKIIRPGDGAHWMQIREG